MQATNASETTIPEVLAEFDRLSGAGKEYSRSSAAWKAAAAFLVWCRANDVGDPKFFMWFRFRVLKTARGHGARPSLQNMCSPALLKRYRAKASWRSFEAEQKQQWDTQFERDLISVNNGNEAVRRDYVVSGRSDLCEVQPGISGGYHPFSKWCPACPRAASCADALNAREGFDAVGLRLGRISQAPDHVRLARVRIG